MSKRPAFQWYPDDWLTDVGLRECSPAARGIWIDLLSLMHQGEPYGHLRKGKLDYSLGLIARTCGVEPKVLIGFLEELEHHAVFSRTESGTIFSRKMVRDEELRELRGAGGRKSLNNANVPKKKGFGILEGGGGSKERIPSDADTKDTFKDPTVRIPLRTPSCIDDKDILTRESNPTDTDTDTDTKEEKKVAAIFPQNPGFDEFRRLMDATGKPLHDDDYRAAATEAVQKDYSDQYFVDLINPYVTENLKDWCDRDDKQFVPFPKSVIASHAWTRKARARHGPITPEPPKKTWKIEHPSLEQLPIGWLDEGYETNPAK